VVTLQPRKVLGRKPVMRHFECRRESVPRAKEALANALRHPVPMLILVMHVDARSNEHLSHVCVAVLRR
jgi:hypothetical protein